MKITEIIVSAGRTFNHPHESYSNFKPAIQLKASVDESENALDAVKTLQAQAEQIVEDHKRNMLQSVNELYMLSERQSEVQGLERTLRAAQERLETIRKENPGLATLQLSAETPNNSDVQF